MTTLENYNIAADPRSQGPATAPVVYMDDGSEVELPVKWAVCPVCEGRGTHVNPAIDAGGLTAEDFADDPDFAEGYMRGDYDQTCNHCKGRTTVQTTDEDACDPLLLAMYRRQRQDEADMRAETLAEIRAGA